MKSLAWVLWILTAVWLVMGLFGALNFQEMYGEMSGVQVFGVVLILGSIPGLAGWWLFRRARARAGAE